jgi:hypothetical protein
MTELFPPYCGAEYYDQGNKDVVAICDRRGHPPTEQHVDTGRGVSWPYRVHYLGNPFEPSSGS